MIYCMMGNRTKWLTPEMEATIIQRGKLICYTTEIRDKYKCIISCYRQYNMSDILHFSMYYSALLFYDILLGDPSYYTQEQKVALATSIHKLLKAVTFFVRPYTGATTSYADELTLNTKRLWDYGRCMEQVVGGKPLSNNLHHAICRLPQ